MLVLDQPDLQDTLADLSVVLKLQGRSPAIMHDLALGLLGKHCLAGWGGCWEMAVESGKVERFLMNSGRVVGVGSCGQSIELIRHTDLFQGVV
jgi:hypothetical protein